MALQDEVAELPDTLLVSLYENTRQKRLALDRESARVKESETIYQGELISRMLHQKTGALASQDYIAKLHEKDVPTPGDWAEIRKFIIENEAWELMHQRLSVKAVAERWEAGQEIPGIKHYPAFSVTISKL